MKTWTTQDGEKIAYKDLKDSHLLNILKFVKRKASEGIVIYEGYMDWDGIPDLSDSYVLYGEEALQKMDYYSLEKEAIKRGILDSMEYTLGQIVREKLLIGRNGPYRSVATITNLIKRKQLKARKGKSAHGPCRLVSIEEIKRYNDSITQKINTKNTHA